MEITSLLGALSWHAAAVIILGGIGAGLIRARWPDKF
jgi:hypothetical protein